MKSKILEFIENNTDSWEEKLNARLIRISRNGDLACFKYMAEADFSDPLVCEARGIVIDVVQLSVVCWPFDKFFNVQEQYAADIDWNSARVLEKIDGSMIKLFWYKDAWKFATSSTCDAKDAAIPGYNELTYADIIARAENVNEIPFEELNKDYTYIFELVSPLSQIVVRYEMIALFFLTARNNHTGEELDTELLQFRRPRSFALISLNECLVAVLALNKGGEIEDEGFVVVDEKHNRVKIKSPAYVAMHRLSTNKVFTVKRMAEFFCNGEDLSKLAKDFPANAHIIKYYDWQFAEMKHKAEDMMLYSRRLYEEYDHDRKAVAMTIKDSPYAWAGFKAIGNDKDITDIMVVLALANVEKLIVEYPEISK
ncbi:RNA ligase [Butyrivibrio fibrisolvens]|uniref:RNA ligase n=1 Tax=Butyrivibrio fibrisolvens TaxID=831 RepID=UPI000406FA56|nr:RNA ligase [Butyrivibrio fibrisolvens]